MREVAEQLYEGGDNALWIFLLLTVIIGGAAAYASGKAIAQTWRPYRQVPFYCLLLAAGVRFCHFALFEEPLLSAGDAESVFLEVTPEGTHWRAKSEGVGATCWRESQILAHPPTVNGCRSLVLRPEADSD